MAITKTVSATGREGQLTVDGNVIAITKWTAKLTGEYADSTDSNNYDTVTARTFRSQNPGVTYAEGTFEGNFDFDNTNTYIFPLVGGDPIPAVFKVDRTTTWGSCDVDITDVEISVEIPGATNITITGNWRSNGVVTVGA